MVGATAPSRGWVLPGCLSALCFCWAFLGLCGLPSLASAEGPLPPCPGPALEIEEEMPQPEREVRGLRNDVREACATLDARLVQLLEAVGKGNVIGEVLEVKLAQLHTDLSPESGLAIRFLGQAGPVETKVAEGTVAVSNPTDVAGVEAAVQDNSETFNSTTWAIFGMVVGFALLAVIFKLVRP
jgi:hypothetical protein